MTIKFLLVLLLISLNAFSQVDSVIEKSKDSSVKIFNSLDKPLIIVDKTEISYNILESIDPNLIANINVFKGQKSIEIYGERGKNGTIIVETKAFVLNNSNQIIDK